VASLDQLSAGRFIFGIGAGWNAEEMENHGTRYETRYQVMRERVLAVKAIWTQEEAAFHGKFVHFDLIWSYPKPMQRPHPPILLGGSTDHTLKRVVEFGDGWLPIAAPGFDAQEAVDRLRRMAAAAGRDPATLSITVFGAPADPAVLPSIDRPGSSVHSSRCRISAATKSCASSTRTHRSRSGRHSLHPSRGCRPNQSWGSGTSARRLFLSYCATAQIAGPTPWTT
jgi:hypothetical protein